MVELRKRKTPPPAPVRPAKKKAAAKPAPSKAAKVKEAVVAKVEAVKEAVVPTNGAKKASPVTGAPAVGDIIDLATFGGEIETHEGAKTTLKALVEESKGGVVLFTYPKASTPGCTTQACLFRDSYTPLTDTGFQIYGLSSDSPKANTTFKAKQNLPYTLLCDPSATLIKAIGLQKAPKGTKRGVFVIDKEGKVLAAETGGPAATVDVVKKLVSGEGTAPAEVAKEKEDVDLAKTASEVADTAAKLDG
ncbi:AhpC-TSA-domain-containing protein [Lophium mytilinum]|uniref:thioredoxin-dependent peroxiredoxin n=1 Tax=Lophium mytilinum TaxID=390894 RepID=A0A6A6QFX8_9PEZI|nr:AhpC-TSA-domain-containing protein [Lophium mytilinum]